MPSENQASSPEGSPRCELHFPQVSAAKLLKAFVELHAGKVGRFHLRGFPDSGLHFPEASEAGSLGALRVACWETRF